VINLAHNKLRDLPNLNEQIKLEELDISKNEIHTISSDDFKQLKKLKTLRLSENFIGKGCFRCGEKVKNHHDGIYAIYLNKISHDSNHIFISSFFVAENIAANAFENLNHLQCLHLKKNLITHIDEKHLKNLRNLIILDLAANKIQSIHSNAFRSLTKVYEMHLSANSLREIPEKLFLEMGRLKKLMLFSNDFRYLHSQCFVGLR
jgi:Leucine-rich repeat (LRR) protein